MIAVISDAAIVSPTLLGRCRLIWQQKIFRHCFFSTFAWRKVIFESKPTHKWLVFRYLPSIPNFTFADTHRLACCMLYGADGLILERLDLQVVLDQGEKILLFVLIRIVECSSWVNDLDMRFTYIRDLS